MRGTNHLWKSLTAALLLIAMVGMASCTKYGGRSTPREPRQPRSITDAPPPPAPDSAQRGTAR